jgi:hypothetical protein
VVDDDAMTILPELVEDIGCGVYLDLFDGIVPIGMVKWIEIEYTRIPLQLIRKDDVRVSLIFGIGEWTDAQAG